MSHEASADATGERLVCCLSDHFYVEGHFKAFEADGRFSGISSPICSNRSSAATAASSLLLAVLFDHRDAFRTPAGPTGSARSPPLGFLHRR